MADSGENPVAAQKRRADRCWVERTAWDAIYCEAYDYAIPQRRPGGRGKSKRLGQLIYDMTATTSIMHGSGQLVRQVFPPGQPPFIMEPGPLLKARLPERELDVLTREFSVMQKNVYPFFQTGDFDTAMHETAVDLFVGTGAIMPIKGPSIEEPLLFVNIPFDEIACSTDIYGRQNLISWKRMFGREAIIEAWPKGRYTEDFRQAAKDRPYDEVELYQDFFRLPDGRWRFVAYTPKEPQFIVSNISRARPIAVPRFYRAPGEPYGRGPLLMALPTIKTVNKAQELALKSAAIQMLGIWGYRAGGTFNPDAVRVGPGEFWPMQSTGGILGPDVSRIDPASGRMDIARLVIGNGQDGIRDALLDTRLTNDGGTPPSAMEVAAKVRQNANVHIGAYGRLVNEITPVIVPRSIEILNEWGLIQMPIPLNPLLYALNVVSPMAMALKADRLQASANYVAIAAEIGGGPQNLGRYVNLDRYMKQTREALIVDPDIVPTPQEIEQAMAAAQQQQLAAQLGAMGERAAPQLVDALREAA
ncbi:portal protein [Phyllobacteriaceae bacterium JZ32]